MDLSEITDLLKIRDYLLSITNNPYIPKADYNHYFGKLTQVEFKINQLISSENFQNYILNEKLSSTNSGKLL